MHCYLFCISVGKWWSRDVKLSTHDHIVFSFAGHWIWIYFLLNRVSSRCLPYLKQKLCRCPWMCSSNAYKVHCITDIHCCVLITFCIPLCFLGWHGSPACCGAGTAKPHCVLPECWHWSFLSTTPKNVLSLSYYAAAVWGRNLLPVLFLCKRLLLQWRYQQIYRQLL